MGCRAIEVKVRYLSSDFSLMFKDQQLNNKQIKTTPGIHFLKEDNERFLLAQISRTSY